MGLLGLLAGAILSGFILAVTMANAGGAWDNAKKWVEKGNEGGKGSDCHKANVVGDTVGDPFKDTSGPSLNILIKLMCILSLTVAPLIAGNDDWDHFYYGFIPVIIGLIITWYCYEKYWKGDITYKDYAKGDVEGNGLLEENRVAAQDSENSDMM